MSTAEKKEEALRFASEMARVSKEKSPRGSRQMEKSPRTSKRDSAFEGIQESQKDHVIAERSLQRCFRDVVSLFDPDEKHTRVRKEESLQKYKEMIENQEKALHGDEKGEKILKEHREILDGFQQQLQEEK